MTGVTSKAAFIASNHTMRAPTTGVNLVTTRISAGSVNMITGEALNAGTTATIGISGITDGKEGKTGFMNMRAGKVVKAEITTGMPIKSLRI